jgi:flagellar motor switch protein FliM
MSILDHIYESNPANIQASSYIPGIKITFKLKIGQVEVPFRVCYPYGLLKDEMLNSFDETNVTRKEEKNTLSANEQLQLINEMKNVHITTQAVLGETTMPIHRLLNLSEGDVIKLDQHINEPLGIKINRKVKLHGYPGEKNGKKAIKIFDQK